MTSQNSENNSDNSSESEDNSDESQADDNEMIKTISKECHIDTRKEEEDQKLENITEQDEMPSEVSDFSYLPQVKWLLYPDDENDEEEDQVNQIDHKLESLRVKGGKFYFS